MDPVRSSHQGRVNEIKWFEWRVKRGELEKWRVASGDLEKCKVEGGPTAAAGSGVTHGGCSTTLPSHWWGGIKQR